MQSRNFQDLPNVTDKNIDDIAHLNGKLVRFDCIVCDMYEEQYFVGVVQPLSV